MQRFQLYLKIPTVDELEYRIKICADKDTMDYNFGYGDDGSGCYYISKEQAINWLKGWNGGNNDFYAYVIRSSDNCPVGEVNFHFDSRRQKYFVGVVIEAKYRGQGYSTEALNLLADKAFNEFDILELYNDFPSSRVAAEKSHKKVGFERVNDDLVVLTANKYRKIKLLNEVRKCKCLLFDVGYTLVNEDKVWQQRCLEQSQTAKAKMLGLSAEDIYNEVVNATKNFLPQYRTVVKKYGFEEVAPFRNEFEQTYSGVPIILETLSSKYSLGVIANQEKGLIERLNAWGILKYFSHIYSSWECGYLKPDIRLFEIALTKMGYLAEECVMIGDRLDNDINPAKSIGMKTIWVKQGLGGLQEPRDSNDVPDLEIACIDQLITLL